MALNPGETQYRYLAVVLLVAAVTAAACGGNNDRSDGETIAAAAGGSGAAAAGRTQPLRVVASTSIMADFVAQVGGERVSVRQIVPANADVHTFTITPGDIRRINDADLVVIAGAGLEASFERALNENADAPVIALSEGLPLRPFPAGFRGDDGDDERETAIGNLGPGEVDPHFWMDIDFVIVAVERLRDALSAIDPSGAVGYSARASAYVAELRALDAEIAALFGNLPDERRYLVSFHDAFGYFAVRYGLTVLGFLVEGPEEEPNAGDVADLIRAMEQRRVPFIFTEPQFGAAVVDQVAEETGAEVRNLHSGTLSDDLPSYVDLMRANANAIAN